MSTFRDNAAQALIARQFKTASVVVGATLGASGELDMQGASGGQLHVPAGPASQVLTVYVAAAAGGTFIPLKDAAGDAVTFTAVESVAYDLPEALFPSGFVKLVAATTAFTGLFCLKG